MFDYKVIVLEALNVARDATVDVMGLSIVLKIFVVREYCGFEGGAE